MDVITPKTEDEAAAVVAAARDAGRRMMVRGGGTQAGLGRPVVADAILSTQGLIGITLYEPAELVISARAGTPVREVEARLAAGGQVLPFEPPDLRGLYGTMGEPTVGGLVAGNWSGPRRVAAGAARDHLIGVRFVNGRGEIIKSGGRVMKNVTGLDLVKLQCGAHGTLGLLTEVTFKVLPKAERAATLVYAGLDDSRASALMTAALTSPFEVSGAAHLPLGIGGEGARTLLRLENIAASVDYRIERLTELTASFGGPMRFADDATASLWAHVRDAHWLAEPRDRAIWRVSVPPTEGPGVVERLPAGLALAHFFDWGGGLIWLAVPDAGDAGASAIRAAIQPVGGHATLIRASEVRRSSAEVFQPLAAPLRSLTRGIKASLDPDRVLNPGRMYADA